MGSIEPLIVIVGETASGKSSLGLELAGRFGGEIICADSRTVYDGMDIGTAKPTRQERGDISHHVLDVVTPDERFTVADFKKLAHEAMDDICARGKLPIMVGGSGLYIDSVIYDYQFAAPEEAVRRDPKNPRHLLGDDNRPKQQTLRPNTLVIGLKIPRDELNERIINRVDDMVGSGLIEEVSRLGAKYGWGAPALQAPGYKAFRQYVDGGITLDEAKNEFIKNDLKLAKRQRTWFKRNNSIHWLNDPRKAVDIVTTFLNKRAV